MTGSTISALVVCPCSLPRKRLRLWLGKVILPHHSDPSGHNMPFVSQWFAGRAGHVLIPSGNLT